MDLAARTNALLSVHGDFVQMRGFEIRHGAQFQQKAQVDLRGEGLLLEGNLIRDSEVGGIRFSAAKDQTAAPIVIRNNWVVNPGHLGIGGGGSSDRLTPENQNDLASGRSPVLIEHNTVINSNLAGLSPGWEWFRAAILAWDSDRTWAINNTIDGGWNPTVWGRPVETIGINLRQGSKRRIRWGPLLESQQVYVNNLVGGSQRALAPREQDIAEANFTDKGTGAETIGVTFRNPGREDYRLERQSALHRRGVDNQFSRLVTHDFYGLPRFPDGGRTVGAYRLDAVPKPNSGTLVEVEFQNGELRRLYEIVS